jgi:hypothetical protein
VRVHGHKGRPVTHLQDDHLIPDAESVAAAKTAGLPWFKGDMVEHAGPAQPVLEAKLYLSLQVAVAKDPGLDADEGAQPRAIARRLDRGDEPSVRMALQRLVARGVVELLPNVSPMHYRLTAAFRSQVDGQ